LQKQHNPDLSSGSDSDDSASGDEDDDPSDDPTGAKELIRQSRKEAGDKARSERKAKKQAEKAESLRMADERRKKQVKLNKLTSISNGGGSSSGSPNHKDMTCHQCGQKGHIQRDCPQSARKGPRTH
jgi:hypothetical protein